MISLQRETSLGRVVAAIDEANSQDPVKDGPDGEQRPAGLLYGLRMSEVLSEFSPNASEELQIAVRGQHIERWLRPRSEYPGGRGGYLAWRREAAEFHAARLTDLMEKAGYGARSRARVTQLIRKEGLKSDPETQTLEDVACLVFLRWYLPPFALEHPAEKVLSIAAKTARKMSARGRSEALTLPLPDEVKTLLVGMEGT